MVCSLGFFPWLLASIKRTGQTTLPTVFTGAVRFANYTLNLQFETWLIDVSCIRLESRRLSAAYLFLET